MNSKDSNGRPDFDDPGPGTDYRSPAPFRATVSRRSPRSPRSPRKHRSRHRGLRGLLSLRSPRSGHDLSIHMLLV